MNEIENVKKPTNRTSFIDYINNAKIKLTIYFNSLISNNDGHYMCLEGGGKHYNEI